jgi:transcriptional regulator with XRE-family HTH domain
MRSAKKWSQEEFAHISGFHRTYVGQIERGEKNISFENLSKIATILGVTLSELLSGLEHGTDSGVRRRPTQGAGRHGNVRFEVQVQKLAKRLKLQHAAMDQTMQALEELTTPERKVSSRSKRTTRRASTH